MVAGKSDLQLPLFSLPVTDAQEYCSSVLAIKDMETWWFLQIGRPWYRGYSRPFEDYEGRWWWRGKPQFSYPLDLITPLDLPPRMPFGRSLLGWQCPVSADFANSSLHFNIVQNLADYGLQSVRASKRRAIRKGLKRLEVSLVDPMDLSITDEACAVWNSHVRRTSWNVQCELAVFRTWWQPLVDMPGTVILGVHDKDTGQLCAWLIARIIDHTVFLDTLASRTDMLHHRPNDTLVFVLLSNAGRLGQVRYGNFFRRSLNTTIEKFKQSMGFETSGVPARVHLNNMTKIIPTILRPASWERLRGDWHE